MFERGEKVKLVFDPKDVRSKSKTHQSFAKDADINVIMGRYRKTGILVDPLAVNPYKRPNFGDFSDVQDLPVMLERIRQADMAFMCLPAAVRERFGNDVSKLLDFVNDPKNLVEAVNLKLLPDSMLPKVEGTPASEGAAGQQAKPASS